MFFRRKVSPNILTSNSNKMSYHNDQQAAIIELLKLKEKKKCEELLYESLNQIPMLMPITEHVCCICPNFIPISNSSPTLSPPLLMRSESSATHPDYADPQRMFKCDKCPKAFRFKSNLSEHKSLHAHPTQWTPFVCPFCKKQCRLKGNLKKHLQVHLQNAEELDSFWKQNFSRSFGRLIKEPRNGKLILTK